MVFVTLIRHNRNDADVRIKKNLKINQKIVAYNKKFF